jgi:hypothetical protein
MGPGFRKRFLKTFSAVYKDSYIESIRNIRIRMAFLKSTLRRSDFPRPTLAPGASAGEGPLYGDRDAERNEA